MPRGRDAASRPCRCTTGSRPTCSAGCDGSRSVGVAGTGRLGVRIVAGDLLEALPGGDDLALGLVPPHPGGALDGLSGLQVLVDGEEVLDLEPLELREVVDVAQVLLTRVVR